MEEERWKEGEIPHFDGTVLARSEEESGVTVVGRLARKSDGTDRLGVAFTDGDAFPCIPVALCAGGRCPYASGMVFGTSDEPLVIGEMSRQRIISLCPGRSRALNEDVE